MSSESVKIVVRPRWQRCSYHSGVKTYYTCVFSILINRFCAASLASIMVSLWWHHILFLLVFLFDLVVCAITMAAGLLSFWCHNSLNLMRFQCRSIGLRNVDGNGSDVILVP